MNLLLLSDADRLDASDTKFVLRDRRHQHVRDILKGKIDRTLRVGLWDGPKGEGRICYTGEDRTELDVEWTEPTPARPNVHLILAVPRPKSLKKLLPEVVALGVGRLTLLRSWRVAQPYLSSPMLTPQAQRSLIADGLMQAGCTRPPQVEVALRFRPFVEDVATHLTDEHRLICHPRSTAGLASARPLPGSVAVAVGPEGGWLDYEVDAFVQAGFHPVHLGPRVLRVETACVALLANIALLRSLRETHPGGGDGGE